MISIHPKSARLGLAGRIFPLLLLAMCLLTAAGAAQAQSAGDLQMLMSLPPEERQALLDSIGRQQEDGDAEQAPERSPDRAEDVRQEGRDGTDPTRDVAPAKSPPPKPTLAAGSTVIITVTVNPLTLERPLEEEQERRIQQLRDGNPYRLDAEGVLHLPGLPPIALAGLNEQQAALRLRVEQVFERTTVKLDLLPLAPTVDETLEPFGYELFEAAAANFAPVENIPVPPDYLLGPGDNLRVNLVGAQNRRLQLQIDRNGEVTLPEIGPVGVAGMRFDDVRAEIERQIAEKMIGVQANVSMGTLRTMRVFILGEARQPGSYTVSGLSTATNALVTSGGISPVGSLRDIQIRRSGNTIATLDLYNLLLRGDTSGDVRLMPGDVIFVPPIGPTVAIAGAVRRPAIYELRRADGQATAQTLMRLAGGVRPDADPAMAVIERIDNRRERVVLNVDLRTDAAESVRVQAGDTVRIPVVRPTVTQGLRIAGHVHRPGPVGFRPGMRLTDALRGVDDLKPDADIHYVLIRREELPTRRVVVLSADLAAAWNAPGTAADPKLQARDEVLVFDRSASRERILAPLLEELRRQSSSAAPAAIVSISGRVKAPGDYPLESQMHVSDLLRAGGGLDDSAYAGSAELVRYEVLDGESRQMSLLPVDINAIREGRPDADIALRPFDRLFVKEVSRWTGAETVQLSGEFRFPGRYPIQRGETIGSVIERAGGFTDLAFLEGAVFLRDELRVREQKLLDDLAQRMRRQWATLALRAGGPAAQATDERAVAMGESLLSQVQSAKAVGRLVIDIEQAYKKRDPRDGGVLLKDGDMLFVPRMTQEVTVMGEVQNPSSHLYDVSFDLDDYVAMSGGATGDADESGIYIIRANGEVVRERGGAWFNRAGATGVRPGDAILVPLDTGQSLTLPLWTSVSTILYNIAVAVAAVGSL